VWVQVLGSGAYGGFPAWNDGSEPAVRARRGDPSYPARAATSLAVSADGHRFTLIEAPLHLPQTLARAHRYAPTPGTRNTPIDSLVLTSPEFEANAGALGLADASSIRVLSPMGLREDLLDAGEAFRSLEAVWTGLPWDRPFSLDRDETLEARFFPLPGPTPAAFRDCAPKVGRTRCGVRVTDRRTGARLVWAPRVTRLDSACLAELRAADLRFVDGTYYANDEPRALRPRAGDATALGHVPIDGAKGSLAWLAGMRGESHYIHLAGSNPACHAKSEASERIRAAQVDVATDGQEFFL
jgi:pyrroloquinoline quinone biosynthesis protein B